MTAPQERRAPLVDALELIGAFVLPTLLLGAVLTAAGGREDAVAGVVVGGLVGAMLARLRGGLYAVRTADGIERRPRGSSGDAGGAWARLAAVEYDPRYDRYLALALAAVGVASLAAVPFVGPAAGVSALSLVGLGLFGLVAALLAYGTSR